MRAFIAPIPKQVMRYDTLGDWMHRGGVFTISTDDALPKDHQFLVALHELVEAYLCIRNGITQQEVDAFDFNFKGEGEPGDDPACPYRREHQFAMNIERLVAHELGVDLV